MKTASAFKKEIPFQSEFSHKFACWASNHNGWSKMKKANKKIAKRKEKEKFKKELEQEE